MAKSKKFVRICPRCGSFRATRTFGRKYISPYFFCQDCNFESPLFPEIDARDIKKLPKMPPSPRYLMWRRPTTAEVKPLERTVEGKNKKSEPVVTAVYAFLIILAILIFVLAVL